MISFICKHTLIWLTYSCQQKYEVDAQNKRIIIPYRIYFLSHLGPKFITTYYLAFYQALKPSCLTSLSKTTLRSPVLSLPVPPRSAQPTDCVFLPSQSVLQKYLHAKQSLLYRAILSRNPVEILNWHISGIKSRTFCRPPVYINDSCQDLTLSLRTISLPGTSSSK